MKPLDFLKSVEHERKLAVYAAEYDGKMRNMELVLRRAGLPFPLNKKIGSPVLSNKKM